MISMALYKREMKGSIKLLLIFGAVITMYVYVLQMLANVGGSAEKAKYFTFFTLFRPESLISGEGSTIAGALLLLAGAAVLYGAGIAVFDRKDLHI